jgi:WD40 repeat protein
VSTTTLPEALLTTRGTAHDLGAYVVACVFDRAGAHAAFALGDGSLHITQPRQPTDWARLEVHDGAVLALAPDTRPSGFITGGDDGAFCRIGADGAITSIFSMKRKWVEQAVSFADGKAGLLACGIGKIVHLFDGNGAPLRSFDHPSTVTGIAFDVKGKRLAASHYNGASLWFTASASPTPRLLEWKGSHTNVAIHPAAEAVVTAMQENALHGWRLADGQHMRMSGYPAKSDSMGFTKNGKYLASSGADAVVVWPFFGGGPMGKPPRELAQLPDRLCTRVACHPRDDVVAAGYNNGTVVLTDIATKNVVLVSTGGQGSISALAWSPAGTHLAFGTDEGFAAIVDLLPRPPG